MPVYAFVVCWVLAGQLIGDERYGSPASEPASAVNRPPLTDDNQGGLRPPPAASFVPPRQSSTAPTTTAEDDGIGIASADLRDTAGSRDNPGFTPETMMRAMLAAPSGSRLGGRPVALADVVAGAGSRQDQSLRIAAYWDLCSSVADYYLGLREQDELQRLRTLVPKVGPAWQQAEAELGVRIGTSQGAAVASQHRLGSMMEAMDAASLPLPSDIPHCGDYYARYDQIFTGRPSAEARQLADLLPQRYEELRDAAAAVSRAEQRLNSVASQRATAEEGSDLLAALELLALRRRAFVQIVRDYNQRISRYTELASPGEIDSERLIGMLIRRESAADTATRPTTTVPPPNRQSRAAGTPPATFAEDWVPAGSTRPPAAMHDEAVQPAAGVQETLRREHSLLVPARGR